MQGICCAFGVQDTKLSLQGLFLYQRHLRHRLCDGLIREQHRGGGNGHEVGALVTHGAVRGGVFDGQTVHIHGAGTVRIAEDDAAHVGLLRAHTLDSTPLCQRGGTDKLGDIGGCEQNRLGECGSCGGSGSSFVRGRSLGRGGVIHRRNRFLSDRGQNERVAQHTQDEKQGKGHAGKLVSFVLFLHV